MLDKLLTTEQLPIWAEEYARQIAAAYNPDCIILFGSVARDDQTHGSDIDILVIGGDLPTESRQRFHRLMALRPRLAPIQIQTFTLAEWEAMLARKHVTALEALMDGRALHGADRFRLWRAQFQGWQEQGLRRTSCSWVIPPALRVP